MKISASASAFFPAGQFGQFHRSDRQVTQDLNLYRVPADLEDLLRILVHRL
ncbi:MAG: hypothetical protein ACFE0J_05260 [Elainellaceae cyanobacterium]